MPECKFCKYFIPEGATCCAHCGRESIDRWTLDKSVKIGTLISAIGTEVVKYS